MTNGQEAAGLEVVTDGEFRRQNYIIDFYFKGFGKGFLLSALALFGKMTAPSEAPCATPMR